MESVTKRHIHIAKTLLLLVVGFCLFACGEPVEKKHVSGGWLNIGSERITLSSARVGNMGADAQELRRLELSLCASTIAQNGISTTGSGAVLFFNLYSATDSLEDGIYNFEEMATEAVCDSATLIIYPKSQGDTVIHRVTSGFVQVASQEWGKQIDWHMLTATGDSLVGRYTGQVFYNKHFDADTVGTLAIDTLKIALQRANVVYWGEFFQEGINYYEYYFYSTDMRHTDVGKIYSGTMFVLGVHSTSPDGPSDGVYPVSKEFENQTIYYGNKRGTSFWGTYWVRYANGNSQSRGNISKDSVRISRHGDVYRFDFQLKDQMGNIVDGTYEDEVTPLTFPEPKPLK